MARSGFAGRISSAWRSARGAAVAIAALPAFRAFLAFLLLMAAVPVCGGQQFGGGAEGISTVSPAMAAVLRQMTRSAGTIFAGTVIAVERPAGVEGAGGGTVTVQFRVDEAVIGPASGSVYTLREWGGLWNGNGDRYRVGQRLLMFLRAPGASGLSSPVHGAEGRVPLRGGGVAPGPYNTWSGAGDWVADLRWVQAQAVRGLVATEFQEGGLRGPERGRTGVSERAPAGEAGALLPVEGGPGRVAHWTEVAPAAKRAYLPLAQLLELCRRWTGPVHVEQ